MKGSGPCERLSGRLAQEKSFKKKDESKTSGALAHAAKFSGCLFVSKVPDISITGKQTSAKRNYKFVLPRKPNHTEEQEVYEADYELTGVRDTAKQTGQGVPRETSPQQAQGEVTRERVWSWEERRSRTGMDRERERETERERQRERES